LSGPAGLGVRTGSISLRSTDTRKGVSALRVTIPDARENTETREERVEELSRRGDSAEEADE
jgi:hypothetical protein